MTGGSDAERKGHKRKLADALQPAAINTPPPAAGEHNPNCVTPQVMPKQSCPSPHLHLGDLRSLIRLPYSINQW